MQKVLLTGGGGFLGSHLRAALGETETLAPRSAELDLLDKEAVERYVKEHGVDTIVHAAGFVGGIGLNKAHPGRMIADNLRMGLNVLETAAKAGGIKVAIVSNVCVYPQNAPIPTPETSMWDGYPAVDTGPYGIAKRTMHTVAESLHKEFGMDYTYAILTNLYGPGDYFDDARSHVIPALLKRALACKASGDRYVAWGDGSQTRDLLYVEDAAKGILATLQPAGLNDAFNLGSGVETTVRELTETICDIAGYEGEIFWDATKPGGAPRRALDATKAKARLGFVPQTPLREGLENLYRWYLDNRDDLQ